MKQIAAGMAVLFVPAFAYGATTWHVSLDGDDENSGTNWSAPFRTIQKALDSCKNEDTVIVSNGVYRLSGQLSVSKEQITIRSLTCNPADVTIDCGNTSRGIYSNKWRTRVIGLSVVNGSSTSSGGGICLSTTALVSNSVVRSCTVSATGKARGGGVYCAQGSEIVDCLVEDCVVSNAAEGTSSHFESLGGGISNMGAVRGCTVRRCSVYSRNGYYGLSMGGGIYAESKISSDGSAEYPASVENCMVYSNKVVSLTRTAAGEGGGVGLIALAGVSSPQTVSNCLVFCNSATLVGGGVSICNNAELVDSTIMSNRADNSMSPDPYSEYVGGGGVYVWNAGGTVRRCLIEGNEVYSAAGKNTQGGGGIRLSGTGSRVCDSVIRGNVCSRQGAAVFFGNTAGKILDGCVISNCWIEGNQANGSGVTAGQEGDGLEITGCAFVSNTVANGSTLYWYRESAKTEGVLFRNCLFRGNGNSHQDSSAVFGLTGMSKAGVTAPLGFEFCSFINESFSSGTANNCVLGEKKSDALANTGNISVTGCLLYGDQDHPHVKLSVDTATNSIVKYTRSVNAPVDDPSLGNFDGTVDPAFADPAGGDYRYAVRSPLRDCGSAVQEWMGTGGRRGPKDLGNGTVTLTPVADHGISVSFNETRPRLYGGKPDIGCFEYYAPPGIKVILR